MNHSLNNLTDYRKAKVLTKDLKEIINILHNCSEQLQPHYKYVPVKHVLETMIDNMLVLNGYLNKYNKILQTKGLVENVQTKV